MALSYDVLRNRDFRRLLATRLSGIFALQAQAVIVGWQIYTLTHDPLMLGLVGLAEAVPAIVFALFAGHIVDKSRPHYIFRNCLLALCMISLVLLLVAGGLVGASRPVVIGVIFSGVFLSGLTRSFIMPSSFTLLSQIVPRHDIPAASAWLSSGFQFAAITGPAVAGLIYGGYGSTVAWVVPFLSLLVAVIIVSGISAPHRIFKNHDSREKALKSIAAGWRFVRHNRVLLPVMALDMFAVLFGGVVAILPVFADQVLHTGSEGLGLLRAAPAVGSIITALYFAVKPMRVLRGRVLLLVIAGFGGAMILFGLSTEFFTAAFFLALGGAFDSVNMVLRGTLMQLLIPGEMRGRVSALSGMFIISSNEIGAFESGLAASLLGLVPSILFGGGMTMLVVGTTALFARELRGLAVQVEKKAVAD
ncbi:MAG: MFS transporter [Alphaproteobacteria bacterium]|nr:MFS transporter [Alphaproteobacteria bacterium]